WHLCHHHVCRLCGDVLRGSDPRLRQLRLNARRAGSDRLPESGRELRIRIMQLVREGSPPPGLRRPQAKLSQDSNQIARGQIRRFESYMPSHAVGSPCETVRLSNSPCEMLTPDGAAHTDSSRRLARTSAIREHAAPRAKRRWE